MKRKYYTLLKRKKVLEIKAKHIFFISSKPLYSAASIVVSKGSLVVTRTHKFV